MSSAYFSGSAADLSSSYRLCQSNAGAVTLCNIPVHDGYVLSWSETRANAAPVSRTAALLNDGGQGYTLAFTSNNTAALSYQASNTIPAVPLVSGPCTLGLSNDVAFSMVLERGRVSLNGLEILSCSNLTDVEWASASLAISGATLSNRVSLCNVDGLPLYTIEPPLLARGGIITPYIKGRLDWGDLSNVPALAPLAQGTWGSNAAGWSSNLAVAAQGVAVAASNTAVAASNAGVAAQGVAGWSSNAAVAASNAAVAAQGVAGWGSNAAVAARNAAVAAQGVAVAASNTAVAASNAAVAAQGVAGWSSNAAVAASNAAQAAQVDKYFTMNNGVVYTASNVFLGASARVGGQICTTKGSMTIALSNAGWNNAQECRVANYNHGSNAFLYLAISPKHDTGYGRGYVQVAGFGYCNNVSQGLQPLNFVSRLGVNSSNPGTYWLDCRGAANADSLYESNVLLSTKYALSNHAHDWSTLLNVPATFAPSNHTHPAVEVTGLATVATTGSYASLQNIPATFAPTAHTHTMADLVGASMVKLGDMGFTGLAGSCHASAANTTTDYAFLQELGAGKTTYMNAPLGGRLKFRVNNVDQIEVAPAYGATRSSLNWPVTDPGRMIQCWYGVGDSYGVGQFAGGTMRAFMGSLAAATFNISKCTAGSDSSYVDLLTVDTNSKMTIKGSSAAASGLYWSYGSSKIYDNGHLRLDTDNNLRFDIAGATAGEFSYRGIRLMQGNSICMVCDGTAAPYWEWELSTGIDGTDHLGNFSWTIWWPAGDGVSQAGETVAYLDDNSLDTRRLNIMGCHRCVAEKGLKTTQDVLDATGLVVIATGRYCSLLEETVKPRQIDNITVDEALPTIELCTKRRDKRVFGVVTAPDNLIEAEVSRGEDGKPARKLGGKKRRVFKQGAFATCAPYDTDRVEINSLGEGAVWVCARGGDFENGDLITTSDQAGYGERQEEPYVCGWTLGKITCD